MVGHERGGLSSPKQESSHETGTMTTTERVKAFFAKYPSIQFERADEVPQRFSMRTAEGLAYIQSQQAALEMQRQDLIKLSSYTGEGVSDDLREMIGVRVKNLIDAKKELSAAAEELEKRVLGRTLDIQGDAIRSAADLAAERIAEEAALKKSTDEEVA